VSPLRLAWASPLPPQASGIADYSAELLPELARLPELAIELAVDDTLPREWARSGLRPGSRPGSPPGTLGDLPVVPLSELPARQRAGLYDAVLYHVGNDLRFHGAIYRTALAVPGIVVLHEYVLHHLVAGLTLGRGDGAAYVEQMRYAYGRTGERLAGKCLTTGVPPDPWAYPLFERIVDRGRGLIVHNQTSRQRILASRPRARVTVIPHHLCLSAGESPGAEGLDPAALRRQWGIPDGALVVASFGFATPEKHLDRALAAFARLRRERPEAVFLIVGEVAPAVDIDRLLGEGRGEGVLVTGRVDLPTFLAAMGLCDVAVNLRHPTGGETSGTLMRLLGLGKAVIVSGHGAFAEIPPGCAAPVVPGQGEAEHLFAVLQRLATDPELRRQMGANARRHMAAHHTLAGSARAFADFLHRAVAEGWQPEPAVPPLAPYPPEDLLAGLARELGTALADLGLADADLASGDLAGTPDLLTDLAAILVDLDCDLSRGQEVGR